MALRDLEKQGWETLPMAILGMPNLPPAWMVDTWKPVGGCKFTGFCPGTVPNSALRFCLLLRWRAAHPPASELFSAQAQGDSPQAVHQAFTRWPPFFRIRKIPATGGKISVSERLPCCTNARNKC